MRLLTATLLPRSASPVGKRSASDWLKATWVSTQAGVVAFLAWLVQSGLAELIGTWAQSYRPASPTAQVIAAMAAAGLLTLVRLKQEGAWSPSPIVPPTSNGPTV